MPSTIKSQLSHDQQLQLRQVKHLNDVGEAFRNRSKSTALRKEILDKQRVRSYQSEYERIRNHIEHSATPARNKDSLKSRAEHLKGLRGKSTRRYQMINGKLNLRIVSLFR